MNRAFGNVYEDKERARAYATLQFPGTYYLAFRELPALIRRYNHGRRALDFGCGTGRSTRFLRNLGLEVIGADISEAMCKSDNGTRVWEARWDCRRGPRVHTRAKPALSP
jgi:ubiquinone/menaquinone biosynthesis C-methylase UbiE